MVIRRSFEKRRYILAGVLTLLIFSLGIMLGFLIDAERLQYYQNIKTDQRLDYNSLQLQYAYINQLGEERNCPALLRTFDESVKSLESARIRLETYNQDSTINKVDFEMLRREYIIAQLRYWLFAKQTKNLCGQDVVTILYFFSDQETCPDCDEQAFVLTYLKKRLGDKLLNFALDEQYLDEPMIEILKESFVVSSFPSLVVEGEIVEGFTNVDDLLPLICEHFTEQVEDCVGYNTSIITNQSVNRTS